MSRNTSNINFYARESKKGKDGLTHIEMSINLNQERVFIMLPMQVKPAEFNSKRRPKEIEDYLSLMRVRVNEIMVDMMAHGEPITASRIREYIRTGGYKSYTIADLFDEYLDILKHRNMSHNVWRKYELVKELYLEYNDGTKEVSAITTYTVSAFQAKLAAKYESSTAAGYLTKLKSFIRYGLDNNKLQQNPFNGITITKEKKDIDYLTEDELTFLESQQFENESLQHVLDLFLFQASTGLSYSDMAALTKDDMQADDKGNKYIFKRRIKTGTPFVSFVMPLGERIWEKYNGNLRVISNQKMNAYLHVIERLTGFKKSLHSHLARHTYSTLLLNKGVRLETVQHAVGHSSVKITEMYYAHMMNETVISEIAEKI